MDIYLKKYAEKQEVSIREQKSREEEDKKKKKKGFFGFT